MPLTVRLGPKSERTLNALARRRRLSRSAIVREALEHYEATEGRSADHGRPYQSWFDVIGVIDLGVRDPSRTTGDQLTAILRERPRARRAR